MTTKDYWTDWNEERQRFLELETLGWELDIANLEEHIAKLQEIAPKDKAGWLNLNALDAINKLKADLVKAKVWSGLMS